MDDEAVAQASGSSDSRSEALARPLPSPLAWGFGVVRDSTKIRPIPGFQTPRKFTPLLVTLDTIWESQSFRSEPESAESLSGAASDSDSEDGVTAALYSDLRVNLLFVTRTPVELRIAKDGKAYPYHEFVLHYGRRHSLCDYYWQKATVVET